MNRNSWIYGTFLDPDKMSYSPDLGLQCLLRFVNPNTQCTVLINVGYSLYNLPNLFNITHHFFFSITIVIDELCPAMFQNQKSILTEIMVLLNILIPADHTDTFAKSADPTEMACKTSRLIKIYMTCHSVMNF